MTEGPLKRIAQCPANCVGPSDTVQTAVEKMVARRVGAVAVVDDGTLVGIFTERDLMTKVVSAGADASTLEVSAVMVSGHACASLEMRRSEALDMMVERHFRHLPIVDENNQLQGMLSIRDLLQHQVGRLQDSVQSLEQYLLADGPGG